MNVHPQTVVLFHHFRRFLEAAAAREIDVAPLKGAHLLTSVYPEGEGRGTMSDVDFLVRPEQWDAALEILVSLGFAQKDLPGRPVTRATFYEAWFYLTVSDRERILFEPHRYLVQPARLNIDYTELWSRSVASTFDGVPCRRLSVEDHILYTVVHLTTHFFSLQPVWLRDLSLLFTEGRPDISVLERRAASWRVKRAAWLVFTLLSESGVGPDVTALCRQLAPPKSVQKLLRLLVPDANGLRFQSADLRLREALLWPAVFDSPVDFVRFGGSYLVLRFRDLLKNFSS